MAPTRMCHVEQSAGSISLHSHILRLGQSCQWAQSPGSRNLCLVVLVSSQICDTSNSITLNFDVRRHHLSYKWSQTAEEDDSDFVLSWRLLA